MKLLSILCILLLAATAAAQTENGNKTPAAQSADSPAPAVESSSRADESSSRANETSSPADDRYRIGPGDVLDVRVFNRPQLSRDSVRVDGNGMIRMPLLDEEIPAACTTEVELAREIARRYLKYQRNPHVDVFVKEYNSQPVAVVGAVNSPGRFQLQRRVRLLELLTFSGGPNAKAGERIQIVRPSESFKCNGEPTVVAEGDNNVLALNLNETLRGEERANPFVQPGDIITLPEAEQAFIVGNVLRPSAIPLKEEITISRAIAMAGGVMPDTKSDSVRIIRQSADGTKSEIEVDLKAINRRQAEDVVLKSGDIVDVPASSGKRFLRSILSAVAPAVVNTPVRVIQ